MFGSRGFSLGLPSEATAGALRSSREAGGREGRGNTPRGLKNLRRRKLASEVRGGGGGRASHLGLSSCSEAPTRRAAFPALPSESLFPPSLVRRPSAKYFSLPRRCRGEDPRPAWYPTRRRAPTCLGAKESPVQSWASLGRTKSSPLALAPVLACRVVAPLPEVYIRP